MPIHNDILNLICVTLSIYIFYFVISKNEIMDIHTSIYGSLLKWNYGYPYMENYDIHISNYGYP